MIQSWIWIPDHISTSLTIAELGILGDLSFLIQSPANFFTKLGETIDTNKATSPRHFWSNPADIQIRIRINLEIRIRITDHFRLTFQPWQSLCYLSALLLLLLAVSSSGCSGVVVEYRTRNREVAGSTHTRSTGSNLEQVANLLCAQANSASYPQRDEKWVVAMAMGWRPSVADWGGGVSASCTVSPIVRYHGQWMAT